MNLKLILGSITFAMLTGCTNIYFDNGVPEKVNNQLHNSSQWHHNFALALYEGSDAVDLSEHCPQGQWQTVHLRTARLTWLSQSAGLPAPVAEPS